MTVLVIGIIIVIILFIMLVGVLGKNTTQLKREEKEDMVKQVYLYAVAFITLIMVIGGGVFSFMSLADYVSPHTYYETFDEYKNMRTNHPKIEGQQVTENLSEEELRAQYEEMIEQRIENSKQNALNSFVKSLGWIIIPLPVFLYFQRRISIERKEK